MDTVINSGWFELSLVQQMLNIGNEVKRAIKFDSSPDKRKPFLDKAIYYTELTMADPKNQTVLPELHISKEVLEDYGSVQQMDCTKDQIKKYYADFQNLL